MERKKEERKKERKKLLRLYEQRKYVNKTEKRWIRGYTIKQLSLFNNRQKHASIDREKKF